MCMRHTRTPHTRAVWTASSHVTCLPLMMAGVFPDSPGTRAYFFSGNQNEPEIETKVEREGSSGCEEVMERLWQGTILEEEPVWGPHGGEAAQNCGLLHSDFRRASLPTWLAASASGPACLFVTDSGQGERDPLSPGERPHSPGESKRPSALPSPSRRGPRGRESRSYPRWWRRYSQTRTSTCKSSRSWASRPWSSPFQRERKQKRCSIGRWNRGF